MTIGIDIDDTIGNLDSVFDVVKDVLLFNSNVNSLSDVDYKRVDNWDEIYNYYLENK